MAMVWLAQYATTPSQPIVPNRKYRPSAIHYHGALNPIRMNGRRVFINMGKLSTLHVIRGNEI